MKQMRQAARALVSEYAEYAPYGRVHLYGSEQMRFVISILATTVCQRAGVYDLLIRGNK